MLSRSLVCNLALALTVTCSCSSSSGTRAVARGDSGVGLDASPAPDAAPACTLPMPSSASTYALRFDQVGYLPEGARWAVVLGSGAPAPAYQIFDLATGCAVGSGTAGPRVLSTTSRAGTPLTGDRVDLSAIPGPGRYEVVLADGSQFGPIVVDGAAYANVVPTLLHFYDVQKCGPTTQSVSLHGPCHLHANIVGAYSGDGIAVNDAYKGAVDASTGPSVDVEGGWHDAGDFIKFVGTSSFALSVNLLALRDHPSVFDGPRAGAAGAALRQEMRWGLDWLVKMWSGAEPYHQVSGEQDHNTDWRMPESDTTTPVPLYTERPAFRFGAGRGANLAGRSSAALALGSQVFASDSAYSTQLIALAKSVYTFGAGVPRPQSPDPPSFYPESSAHDDMAFGAAILAQITGDAQYAADALTHARAIGSAGPTPSPLYWGDVSALAYLEAALAQPDGSPERTEMAADLVALAAPIVAIDANPSGPGAAFHYALASFDNGSIEESLGAGAVCLASMRLGGSAQCAEIARTQLHWMLGQNPFGVSFMVGMGTAFTQNLHHSVAQAAHVMVPGAIAGGPTSLAVLQGLNDSSVPIPDASSPFARWSTDACLYDDVSADYVVNEPAIDFTGPLVFSLGELLAAM